jgi:hypothetical protein
MRIKLRPEARARLRPALQTVDFFAELRASDLLADARRVLAHALPPRRALWWGCLCAWEAYRPEPPADVLGILRGLTEYVQQPDDGQRRALRALGMAAGMNTLAGHLALAAFCSTGSLSKPGLPTVSPAPFVTGRLVGVAVYLASVKRAPARYRERLAQFLEVGLEVARGDNLWPEPTVQAVVPARREPARPRAVLTGSSL